MGAEVGILFSAALNDPPAKVLSFLDTCAGQAGGAYVHLNVQELSFVGQSSLRSDSRSTAKSITTSALSDVLSNRYFRGDKQQVHRCSCNESNEFLLLA